MKEVKYLIQMNIENIPREAVVIHASCDLFREYTINLDYATASYNNIMQVSSSEERALIKKELIRIKTDIDKGVNELKWNSAKIGICH